jgi:predicted tellurium resistance membrane protein TerC
MRSPKEPARRAMHDLLALAQDPTAWAALIGLVVMEVVLGVDNLVFVAVLSNTLPASIRGRARLIGLIVALGLRIALLSGLVFLTHLTAPLIRPFGHPVSGRDLILVAGGLFLVWKATQEMRGAVSRKPELAAKRPGRAGFAWAVVQIVLLDLVFSVDSLLTAVGMTDRLPIMVLAVVLAVGVMIVAAGPLAAFLRKRPSLVMLALVFLLMIGAVLIADGVGLPIPRGYLYAAMGVSALVQGLNLLAARRRRRTPGSPVGPRREH